jgi:hypothetical protein
MVRRKTEEGYGLLLALVVLFFVSFALSLLADGLALRSKLARSEADAIHLTALADAAVAEALAGLSQSVGYTGAASHPVGTGTVQSQVTRLSPLVFEIDASGTYDGQTRRVSATVQINAGSLQVVSWRRLAAS